AQPVTALWLIGAAGIIDPVLGGPHNDPARYPGSHRLDSRRPVRAFRPDPPFAHRLRAAARHRHGRRRPQLAPEPQAPLRAGRWRPGGESHGISRVRPGMHTELLA